MNTPRSVYWRAALCVVPLVAIPRGLAQDDEDEDSEIIELDPFVVAEDENIGYLATHTLAGTRIRTDLRDVGSAISVVTEEFLEDTGANDNESLLVYTTSTEVGGPQGNFSNSDTFGQRASEGNQFANPSTTTRVRGLDSADNTRDYFLSDIPWDGFNVDRVDMQRGPNAILFGLGSPAGIINNTITPAGFFDGGDLEFRVGSYGSNRASVKVNQELLSNELAVRFAAVRDDTQFRQQPAYELDERIYAAIRYDPEFLKFEGARGSLRVNYEYGQIEANRPRNLPPVDLVTPFFLPVKDASGRYLERGGVAGRTFGVFEMQDNLAPYNDGRGQNRSTYDNGPYNPDFMPAIGSMGSVFGGGVWYYDYNNTNHQLIYQSEFDHIYDIATDGGPGNSNITGTGYQRVRGIAAYSDYVRAATAAEIPAEYRANLPYADFAQYKDFSLTDASIFDFYNNLIDGPTKAEWSDWNAYNINFSQTILDNRLGIEVVYDSQEYSNGTRRLFNGGQVGINVDINDDFFDGSTNPNAGRPFISGNATGGNNSYSSDREVLRATAFGELRANDFLEEGWLTRILGRVLVTGLYVDDEVETENRNWAGYVTSYEYTAYTGAKGYLADDRTVNPVVYLGDSLLGKSSASGIHLSRVKADIQPMSGQMLWFDSHWNRPDLDPSTPWVDQFGGDSTESENPANYVGAAYGPVTVLSARDGYRDFLTRGAQLASTDTESWALVGQGYFLDEAIVGVYGYRDDEQIGRQYQAPSYILPQDPDQEEQSNLVDLNDAGYSLSNPSIDPGVSKGASHSYSLAIHFHKLPGMDFLPFDLSYYYNKSSNFRPSANRVDLLGRSLGPPSGKTIDRSILISTKDNKYSLKITKFQTNVFDSGNQSLANEQYFIGIYEARGASWSNLFQYDLSSSGAGIPGGENTYAQVGDETVEEAAAREAAAVAGWRAHQANIRAWSAERTGDPETFYNAWNIDTESMVYRSQEGAYQTPQGLTFTQDAATEGYEFEFTANPTPNWRISLNASKVEAVRKNVGGTLLKEFIDLVTDDVNNTTAGDLRLWWGSPGSPTFDNHWNGSGLVSTYKLLQLLEGTPTGEVRKWRFNLVTNYSFDEGFLDGLSVGAGYRWQDKVIIGYGLTEIAGETNFDLSSPYYGPSEDAIDFWVSYERELNDSLTWKIQLNVRNLGQGEDLIPISTQPDGTPAAYRIAPYQEWFITNTISF